MIIGINATAAVKQPRTGVEEYTYQLIKHLTMLPEAAKHRFILLVPSGTNLANNSNYCANDANIILSNLPFSKGGDGGIFDFPLPNNFEIKALNWPLLFLWTQIRLAWEILIKPPKALFIPVHILPIFHPKNSVVTIHGLEYEYFPEYYPFWFRQYLRWSTKFTLKHARKIIAISENTKRDLVRLYGGDAEKIKVVHHGILSQDVIPAKAGIQESGSRIKCGMTETKKPYLLYLGRIEQKKNIEGISEAYKILKEEYKIPHQLVLAGALGYGYESLRLKNDIIEMGYVSEDEKWQLLANADIFLFPSFYEGFGLPVLEAQAASVPVITSFGSSLPEISGEGALFVNPKNVRQIAEAVKSIIDDKNLRDRLIQSGYENLERFSWEKCARETLKIIVSNYESRAGS